MDNFQDITMNLKLKKEGTHNTKTHALYSCALYFIGNFFVSQDLVNRKAFII